MIWNPRGSVWHRWEPHIHAPGTLLSDQFNGDWDGYFTAIEKSDPIIRALGVTDYLCLETYKEVRRRKEHDKRLPGVFCIFPNVEFRLDIKTAKERAINIHLLFSPDDPKHEYEIESILRKLTFEFQGRSYACCRPELIALGRAFDKGQTHDVGALRAGANQFKIGLANLQKVFREDRKWLSKNCLVAVAGSMNDGTAGLKEDDSFVAFRRELESFAHIIFAATPKQREFWLGRTPVADKDAIETNYKALKPCMHGSDAHRVDRVGKPDQDRYCWLKGDLSFETLRQAVLEPADRVWIADTLPVGPSPSETLRHIQATGAPWLATPSLPLNSGLITIIGARGSGKTALMEFLAAGAKALTAAPSESSFINRAGDLLEGAQVTLAWTEDGKENTAPLHSSYGWLNSDTLSPEVCYLSQQFVERLCSSSGLATELRDEMERVVFEATPADDRMECESFRELANLKLDTTRVHRQELQNSITGIGDEVLKQEVLRDQIPTLNKTIQVTKSQIAGFQKELRELLPKDKEAHTKKLQHLEDLCAKAEAGLQGLRARQQHINDLAADIKQTIEVREPSRFYDLQTRFSGAGLGEEEWKAFHTTFVGDVNSILQNASSRIETTILIAVGGDPENPLDPSKVAVESLPLKQLRKVRDTVKKEVGIDTERQKKYEVLQRTIAQLEATLHRTEEELKGNQGAPERRNTLLNQRRAEYSEVFKTFVEEENKLVELYNPLRNRLKEAQGTLGKLEFVVQREVNLENWVERGEGLIDLRQASALRGHGALRKKAEECLLGPWKTGGPEEVAEAMEQFRNQLYDELQKALPDFSNPQQKRQRLQEIAGWLYDTSHISIEYGISYEGIPIERLSPGTRGIVLLLLYLAIDIHDRRPLFIDQPEENLDPRSVYTELVPHFRAAKQRRQIVMVTHNANLVVNTDADQVIVATSERKGDSGLPTITYASGSIENPEIRKSICLLLEGGRRAFLEREKRYRIDSSSNTDLKQGED
jgi:hypothetical protein